MYLFFFYSLILLTGSFFCCLCFYTLLNSGSLYCFIDFNLAYKSVLLLCSIALILLRLFNSSSNIKIQFTVVLNLLFPTGDIISVPFYVTDLPSPTTVVLEYNWLICYNLSIDWVSSSITFLTPAAEPSTSFLLREISLAPPLLPPKVTLPYVSLIRAAAYVYICELFGSMLF